MALSSDLESDSEVKSLIPVRTVAFEVNAKIHDLLIICLLLQEVDSPADMNPPAQLD